MLREQECVAKGFSELIIEIEVEWITIGFNVMKIVVIFWGLSEYIRNIIHNYENILS